MGTEPVEDPIALARTAAGELAAETGWSALDALVVLGTGLSSGAELLGGQGPGIDLAKMTGFHPMAGLGHRARAWPIEIEGCRTLVSGGRSHLYEGCTVHQVVHLVRSAIFAGARTIVLTCSAGSTRHRMTTGELVLIADHLNLTGVSPITGLVPRPGDPNDPGPPFVDLTEAWSPRLRARALQVRPELQEAVYAQVPGPHFETPAEVRMLSGLGADLIGMSTVVEAIAARHLGAQVLGFAVAANPAAGVSQGVLNPDEIRRATSLAVPALTRTLRGVLASVPGS